MKDFNVINPKELIAQFKSKESDGGTSITQKERTEIYEYLINNNETLSKDDKKYLEENIYSSIGLELQNSNNKEEEEIAPQDYAGKIVNNLNIELRGISASDIESSIGDIGSITSTDSGVIINISRPDDILNLGAKLPEIAAASLKTVLMSAALGILKGKEDKGEIPITTTQFQCTDINDYVKRVKKETPEYADVLTTLAAAFVKDGAWDYEGYKAFLDNAAGEGGKLNKDELEKALSKMQKENGFNL